MENVIKAAEKWIESHPYLKDIAALHLACEKAVAESEVIKDMPEITDSEKEKFKEGVSLLQCINNLALNKTAGKILTALSSLKDNKELPEKVRQAAEKLSNISTEKGSEIISSVLENDEKKLKAALKDINADKDIIIYFAWVSIRKALSGIKDKLEKFISENIWQKGQCPVCGNEASTAFFKHTKRGRQRFLHCDHCGTEWDYKRIGCPYCENIDQKEMSIKDSQDEPDMRIDLCHKCNSYIKTYVGESEKSAGKEGWASIHLDLLMKDSGFSPKGCLVKP